MSNIFDELYTGPGSVERSRDFSVTEEDFGIRERRMKRMAKALEKVQDPDKVFTDTLRLLDKQKNGYIIWGILLSPIGFLGALVSHDKAKKLSPKQKEFRNKMNDKNSYVHKKVKKLIEAGEKVTQPEEMTKEAWAEYKQSLKLARMALRHELQGVSII